MLWKIVLLACSLLWSTAVTAAPPVGPGDLPRLMAAKKGGDDPKAEGDMSEEEKEKAAEEERKKKDRLARVIVLRWKDTTTDYADGTVQRNVRSRIDRPDALFFPEVDLYQNGRKLKDKSVVPAMQPAIVPTSNVDPVLQAVADTAAKPYNALQPYQWGLKAQELQQMIEMLWFVDRPELREPLFLLYAQTGKAADNQNHPAPPFFEQVGAFPVNYYWYEAAVLAQQEPALMSKLTDQELVGSIGYYLEQLQKGAFPTIKVDFQLDDYWNAEEYMKTYEILFNGLPVEPDENAQIPVFLGRTDIYLKRKDSGHGLSERLEVTKLDDKFYPVIQNARKRMGIDFIDQLFLHPNECTPDLDGDILNYLSIYAKIHPKAEIYIAVPENGNPNKVWIWRYDRKTATLSLVQGAAGDFPVRFALVLSSGMLYNGAAVSYDKSINDSDVPQNLDSFGFDPSSELSARLDAEAEAGELPLNLELRGHYNRLMVVAGMEWGYNISKDANGWVEYYQTPGNQDEATTVSVDENPCAIWDDLDEDGEQDAADGECTAGPVTVFHTVQFNRYLYFGSSVVLLRDAGLGFGPRIGFRFGWTNMPHGLLTTLDAGWAIQPPLWDAGGRVRPLIDLDFRGGAAIALNKSLQLDLAENAPSEGTNAREKQVMPVFGGTVGIGLTF